MLCQRPGLRAPAASRANGRYHGVVARPRPAYSRLNDARSAPTAAAMSIECTTSANSTVTCLYSADRLTCVTGAPHSLQNLEFGATRPTRQSSCCHRAATVPGAAHVNIVSPLINDVRHIAVLSLTRS